MDPLRPVDTSRKRPISEISPSGSSSSSSTQRVAKISLTSAAAATSPSPSSSITLQRIQQRPELRDVSSALPTIFAFAVEDIRSDWGPIASTCSWTHSLLQETVMEQETSLRRKMHSIFCALLAYYQFPSPLSNEQQQAIKPSLIRLRNLSVLPIFPQAAAAAAAAGDPSTKLTARQYATCIKNDRKRFQQEIISCFSDSFDLKRTLKSLVEYSHFSFLEHPPRSSIHANDFSFVFDTLNQIILKEETRQTLEHIEDMGPAQDARLSLLISCYLKLDCMDEALDTLPHIRHPHEKEAVHLQLLTYFVNNNKLERAFEWLPNLHSEDVIKQAYSCFITNDKSDDVLHFVMNMEDSPQKTQLIHLLAQSFAEHGNHSSLIIILRSFPELFPHRGVISDTFDILLDALADQKSFGIIEDLLRDHSFPDYYDVPLHIHCSLANWHLDNGEYETGKEAFLNIMEEFDQQTGEGLGNELDYLLEEFIACSIDRYIQQSLAHEPIDIDFDTIRQYIRMIKDDGIKHDTISEVIHILVNAGKLSDLFRLIDPPFTEEQLNDMSSECALYYLRCGNYQASQLAFQRLTSRTSAITCLQDMIQYLHNRFHDPARSQPFLHLLQQVFFDLHTDSPGMRHSPFDNLLYPPLPSDELLEMTIESFINENNMEAAHFLMSRASIELRGKYIKMCLFRLIKNRDFEHATAMLAQNLDILSFEQHMECFDKLITNLIRNNKFPLAYHLLFSSPIKSYITRVASEPQRDYYLEQLKQLQFQLLQKAYRANKFLLVLNILTAAEFSYSNTDVITAF